MPHNIIPEPAQDTVKFPNKNPRGNSNVDYVYFRLAGRLDECYFRDAGNDEARGASSYAINVAPAQNNTHQCLQILHLASAASDS